MRQSLEDAGQGRVESILVSLEREQGLSSFATRMRVLKDNLYR